ncbi:VOC family protein [Kangiella sediminilitoris]|uniref:Putative ring-cleaving dioxygenase n=1 Tax=Kangiella sediminilitoris TaxID=1144748 RepID=A0A1B3BC08_9GAMM|nr:VOC family protein [Kangiella sediminilitoris]AOE50332.1 Putative ring-cleaving dioxygenase [Kangiella sediminilitoris]
MFKVTGIDHIVLRTSKLEQMLHFYRGILGCEIERETPANTGLIQLRAGSALIDIVTVDSKLGRMGGGPPTNKDNNLDHFCLQLKSISEEAIKQHLESHGIEAGSFSERYGAQGFGQSIYIQDPEGNTVELRSEQ